MSEADLRSLFQQDMPGRFQKGALDRDVTFYFSLGEGPGEKWTVAVGPEKCDIKEGKPAGNADCVLKTTSDFFMKMIRDRYEPGTMDFMRGKIKSNDPFLLKELKKAFAL